MLVEKSGAFQQTTDHLIGELKARFVESARLYNRIFYSFAIALALLAFGALITSGSALAFGIFAVTIITALLIAYVVSRFCAERKEEEGTMLAGELIEECQRTFSPFESADDVHLIASDAARDLARALEGFDQTLCPAPFPMLHVAFQKLSRFMHYGGVYALRRALLLVAAKEIIAAIITHPTSAEHHKKLAIVYLEEARLHVPERTGGGGAAADIERYDRAIQRAVAQLGVAKHLGRHLGEKDPWLYEQLIECLGALGERTQLLEMCAEFLEMMPERPETLYCVGRRYFEYGLYAEGLRLYERLLLVDSERAHRLLRVYHRHLIS